MRRVSIALALSTLLSARAPSQEDASAIPRELALALIGSDMRGTPTITIGRAPDGFMGELIPANARVLGGIAYAADPRGARTMTAIVVVPDSAESGLAKFEASLERSGWTQPPMPGASRGGFVSSGMGDRGPSFFLCRDSSSLWLNAKPRLAGGSTLHISLTPRRGSMCDGERMRMMSRGDRDDLQLPTLRPPAGVYSRSSGRGSGGNYSESDTELGTTMNPADLASHFTNQLREQGWTLGVRASDATAVVQIASHKDGIGRALTGVLGVVATPGTDIRHVWIRVVREGSERP